MASTWVCADREKREDHDRARHLRQAGTILPLERIVEKISQGGKGRLLKVELEQRHGVWIYEIKRLDEQGRLLELEFDAETGDLLRSREDRGEDE
ncbi:MAG: PepSY domain-containing protein [Magnetococcales bacterium]|nr:PepSY domain-containing protein [Magnetococcales bacterium]